MDLWVGMIILEEVVADRDGDKDAELLTQHLEYLTDKIDEADKVIQNDTLMLATVAETPLVQTWREFLVEPYKLAAPYWLDDTLE